MKGGCCRCTIRVGLEGHFKGHFKGHSKGHNKEHNKGHNKGGTLSAPLGLNRYVPKS